jgi:hypothetical protein
MVGAQYANNLLSHEQKEEVNRIKTKPLRFTDIAPGDIPVIS